MPLCAVLRNARSSANPASARNAIRPRLAAHSCRDCNDRGYRGRVAIYEFFVMTDEVADSIEPGVRAGLLRRLARKEGWRSLRERAWVKVQAGLIPVSEQQRLTHQLDLHGLRNRLIG